MCHSLRALVHSIPCCTACPSCGCQGSLSLLDVSRHIVWLLSLQHCLMYIDWTSQASCPNRCMTPPAHRGSNPPSALHTWSCKHRAAKASPPCNSMQRGFRHRSARRCHPRSSVRLPLQAQIRTEPAFAQGRTAAADVTDPYSHARDSSAQSCAHIGGFPQIYAGAGILCGATPLPKQRRLREFPSIAKAFVTPSHCGIWNTARTTAGGNLLKTLLVSRAWSPGNWGAVKVSVSQSLPLGSRGVHLGPSRPTEPPLRRASLSLECSSECPSRDVSVVTVSIDLLQALSCLWHD